MFSAMLPKDGRTPQVLVPVRVSDPTKQDERSLGDQRVKIENFLKENFTYPFKLEVLEGRQSGELLDRKEFRRLGDRRLQARERDRTACWQICVTKTIEPISLSSSHAVRSI
jgi:hypothetical protein